MLYLLMRALLMVIFSLHALASENTFETLEEMRLASFQAEHYHIAGIYPYTYRKIAIFIESSPGKAIPQTSEVISYDENSPEFMPHFCEDKVYEFPQKGKERLDVRQAENDEFDYGRMDEVKDTFKAPYKFFGNLLITFPYSQESKNRPGRCIGSGLLMGPNQVLTAGHNIFDPKRGGWAKEIIFTPAQQKENKPFGEARATVLKTFKGWIESKGEIYDMGVLILDRPLGYQAGWAGLAIIDDNYYDKEKPSIAIAGYPSTDVRLLTQEGEAKISYAVMREHQGTIERPEVSRLYYKVNTRGGQSGSPIVAYLKELKGYFVLGIHTHAFDEANEGTRLTATKFWAIHECREQFNMLEADQGYAKEQYNLGLMYKNGQGVDKDEEQAFAFFSRAAEKGYVPALEALGELYEQKGEEEGLLKAASLYEKTIEAKSLTQSRQEDAELEARSKAKAYRQLGLMYLEGRGRPKKPQDAIDLLEEAARNGDMEACRRLARIYKEGEFVTPNESVAAQYYKKIEIISGCPLPTEIHTFMRQEQDKRYPIAINNILSSSDKKESNVRSWDSFLNVARVNTFHNLEHPPANFVESFPKGSNKSYLTLVWDTFYKSQEAITASLSPVKSVSLCGMGGTGKSYIALAYAHEARIHKAYDFIYWFSCDSEEKLIEGYKKLMNLLVPPKSNLKEPTKGPCKVDKGIIMNWDEMERTCHNSFYKELRNEAQLQPPESGNASVKDLSQDFEKLVSNLGKKLLLIYDNVPTPSFLENKFPQIDADILVTSRYASGWENIGWNNKIINLDVFLPEESVNYLLDRIKFEPSRNQLGKALELADELGHLPLALSHAAGLVAYCKKSGYTIEKYLKDFKKVPRSVFESEDFRSSEDRDSEISYQYLIEKTWALTSKEISPLGRDLIIYFSYLDPEFIVVSDFSKYASSKMAFISSLSQLEAFSLIKQNLPFASVHRLVQFVIRARQESSQDIKERTPQIIKKISELLIEKCKGVFMSSKSVSYEDVFKYSSNILVLLEHIKRLNITLPETEELEWVGKILYSIELYMKSRIDPTTFEDIDKFLQLLNRGEHLFGSLSSIGNLEALTPLREIINDGGPSAQAALGYLYYYGYWVPQNVKYASELFTKAADQGDTRAQFNLGVIKAELDDIKPAIELLKEAAKGRDSDAQTNLSILRGEHDSKDWKPVKDSLAARFNASSLAFPSDLTLPRIMDPYFM